MTAEDSRRAQCLGRSRGGLSTKIHPIGDGSGLNLATGITPGQNGDSPMLKVLLGRVRI